jgi:uncharacterized protein (DUF305 family)
MEIGTVLLGADSVQMAPRWWNMAAGIAVHQAADLAWAIVFFALGRHWTRGLTPARLFILALPWAAMTAAIEYYVILPRLQPLVVMQVPFWTALGVHVTSGLLYPFYPQVRAFVRHETIHWPAFSRAHGLALATALVVLCGLEVMARMHHEPAWPLVSAEKRAYDATFLRHMTAHHAVGVELATLAASNGGSPDLRDLGRLMVANQMGEIGIMQRWWRSWKGEPMPPLPHTEHRLIPGMPQPETVSRLRSQHGGAFDDAFIPVMIAHHRGAVQMADAAWNTAGDSRVRVLADSIRHAQSRQITAMDAMARRSDYPSVSLSPRASGWRPSAEECASLVRAPCGVLRSASSPPRLMRIERVNGIPRACKA